jgi:ParB/RepB/Spo0J family partition protein
MNQTNNVPVDQVFINGNIRTEHNEESFNALKESINTVGQLVPITVFEEDGKFCILTGHQRFKALQELGCENVLLQVVPKPSKEDHSLHQYHENMFRVEMSLFDQVDGLRKIASENPKITYAQLSARFGKDVKWVASRMKLANLIKPLYNKEIIIDENFERLVDIGSYSQAKQANAYKNADDSKDELWYLVVQLRESAPRASDMFELFDKDVIDEYWDSYKKKKKTKSLFDELSIQWDWDFVDFCLKDAYPDRLALLNEIPIKPLEGYDELHQTPNSWTMLFTAEEKKLSQIQSWTGSLSNVRIKVKKTASAKTSMDLDHEPIERSRFSGCGTKIARAITPDYKEYVMKGLRYEDNVLEWLREIGEYRFSLGRIDEAFNKEILPNFGINEVGKLLLEEYISYCIDECTIGELSMLATKSGKSDVTFWINECFSLHTKVGEEFRRNILKAFTKSDLEKAYKTDDKTKSDLVDKIAKNYDKFKFNGLFKDKDANFWDQKCKPYLKTEE